MAFTREQHREHQAEQRKSDRDIQIPPVADPQRRLRAESDPFIFLETYCSDRFFDDWTEDRRLIVEQIRYRAKHGGDKAIAAPRGEGKTTFAECEVGVDAIVTGLLRYPLIVAASGPDAERILSNIKCEYETNETLLEDYPEVCSPIVALEGAPQRANMQTYRGQRTRLKWSSGYVVFPSVKLIWCPRCYYPEPKQRKNGYECPKCKHEYQEWQSKSSGSIIEAKGLDGSIRGLRRGNLRPDFVIIDDAETEESARKEGQIENRERKIEQDIGGLGGARKPVPRLMLCTIQNTMCLSAKYTDRMQKPAWDGDRLGLVRQWPTNEKLWETYIEKRKTGMQEDPPDKLGRKAHQFYLDNREAMDEGVEVSNADRFVPDILGDGTQAEVSTIQHVYNNAADKGWDYVWNELQNEPRVDESETALQMIPGIITGTHKDFRGRLNGLEPGVAPATTDVITAFIDVQWDRLYYSVQAWCGKYHQRHVIDYADFGGDIGTKMTKEDATIHRILTLHRLWRDAPYEVEGANPRYPDIVFVDAGDGNVKHAVFTACNRTGFYPSMGDHRFKKPKNDKTNVGPDPWHINVENHEGKRLKVIVFSVEPYRHRSRDSWLTIPDETATGTVYLWGENPANHREYAHHLDVKFERSYDEKKGWQEKWLERRRHDWWDCDYGNIAAHSIYTYWRERQRTKSNRRYGVLSKKGA